MNKFFISILFVISGAYAIPEFTTSNKESDTVEADDIKTSVDSKEALKDVKVAEIDTPQPSTVLDIMMQASKLILQNKEGEVSNEAALAFVNAKLGNKYANHSTNKE